MACYHPRRAWRVASGISLVEHRDRQPDLHVPCGKCVGCKLDRSVQWAVRCMHEAQMHEQNSFVTLTYDDAHCPWTLVHDDFRLFMRRLRKLYPGARYFMAGEYGEKVGRPHFHAILFGVGFPDLAYLRKTASGSALYRSAILESLWRSGYSSVGTVNFESAAYVARYCVDSFSSGRAFICDSDTGELIERSVEYGRMSLKPGIGAAWYEKYRADCLPRDYVVAEGHKVEVPRFYRLRFARDFPEEAEALRRRRVASAESKVNDNTPKRLASKEACARAKLAFKKRSID